MEDIIINRAPLAVRPDLSVNRDALRVLSEEEIDTVSGGFVCGGLCIAGAAFAAGAIVGAGGVTGYYAAKRS